MEKQNTYDLHMTFLSRTADGEIVETTPDWVIATREGKEIGPTRRTEVQSKSR